MNRRVIVMGLGNVLLTDDGAGPAALHRLARWARSDPRVSFIDGGTLGMTLLGFFERDVPMIIIDAVQVDEPPGTIVRLEGQDVARAAATQLSTHQVGVADLLSAAEQLGITPEHLVLVGVVPARIGLGVERTPVVAAAIPALVDAVIAEVERAGIKLARREVGDAAVDLDVSSALGL